MNDGDFTIAAANGDTLLGSYTDFQYAPNPAPATDFTGTGSYVFTGETGIFEGAVGAGSWVAQAEFFESSETMGIANHDWTGGLLLSPTEAGIGDCNFDNTLDANDLNCLKTIAVRDAVLESLKTLPSDLNGDGNVGFADFMTLAENFGGETASYRQGDIDLNGEIRFSDFLILSSNYQGAAEVAAVPEPNAHAMVWMAMLGLCLARFKRHRLISRA